MLVKLHQGPSGMQLGPVLSACPFEVPDMVLLRQFLRRFHVCYLHMDTSILDHHATHAAHTFCHILLWGIVHGIYDTMFWSYLKSSLQENGSDDTVEDVRSRILPRRGIRAKCIAVSTPHIDRCNDVEYWPIVQHL